MGFIPLQSISVGVSDTTQINALIDSLNRLITGFDSGSVLVNESASLAVTVQTPTDIPSVSTTVTVTGANAYAVVLYRVDVSATVTTSNNVMQTFVTVDGTLQSLSELLVDDRISRASPAGFYRAALTAGSHTIKLQAQRAQAAGTFTINHAHLIVQTFDVT